MLIGFDIGGTKIEVCVIDNDGETRFKKRIATPQSYDEFVTIVAALITLAEESVGETCSVGIGLPGTVSPATDLIKNANCLFLNGKDLQADLQKKTGKQIKIANDANCFALSEAVDGAGQHGYVVFGAILGTGCGGGLVLDKKVWAGLNAIGGEWGHNPLPGYTAEKDGPARACYCGRDNCIEQFISGTGFEKSYRQKTGQSLSAGDIIQLMRQNAPAATECYQEFIEHMARSFASVINLLDPDEIVLGGGLSNVDEIYRDLPEATLKYLFTDVATLHFRKAKYGDSSGIRGAAWLNRCS